MRGLVPVLAVAVALSSAPAAFSAQPESSASAFGVRVVLPGQNAFVSTAVSGPPGGQASAPGFVFPANAIAVATGAISVESRTQASSEARAFARAEVHNVSLLGGEIRADTVIAQAGARAVPAAAGGQLSDSTVVNLEVLGAPVAVTPNAQVALGDWGYVVTLEQAVVTDDIGRKAYRGFVVALHVHLTKAHAGLPAGTELLVGYAETGVKAGDPAPEPGPEPPALEETEPVDASPPPPSEPPPPTSPPPPRPAPAAPESSPPRRSGPPLAQPRLTGQGFVFPVYGPSSFSADFAAPRPTTVWHHGNDVYAPLGAPVLAVAGGELFLVGWNSVGGNRLWLRDADGNEYYYAHLSAYTPLAADGAQVAAGDVLGFVGTSGDAAGTPPHLHFEIHPRALVPLGYDGVIDPFSYLSAWQRVEDADFVIPAAVPGAVTPAAVPAASAALVGAIDISSVSGLDSVGLENVLTFRDDRPGGVFSTMLLPRRSPLVGASPGFSSP